MWGREQMLALPQEPLPIFLKEQPMVILPRLKRFVGPLVIGLRARFLQWTTPLTSSLPLQTLADLGRSKSELVAENALLRQQLIILKRQVKRPACTKTDRVLLVLLAQVVRTWKQAHITRSARNVTALASGALPPVLEAQVKGLFSQAEGSRRNDRLDQGDGEKNRLWGAERIRGELLKLGLRVCKRTIQKYMRTVRTHQPGGQTWATFLRTHAAQIWACELLQVTDLFFRPLAGVLPHRIAVTQGGSMSA